MEERGPNRMERCFSLKDRRQSLGFEESSQVHCQGLPTSSSEARSHSSVPRHRGLKQGQVRGSSPWRSAFGGAAGAGAPDLPTISQIQAMGVDGRKQDPRASLTTLLPHPS